MEIDLCLKDLSPLSVQLLNFIVLIEFYFTKRIQRMHRENNLPVIMLHIIFYDCFSL